jgi:hypothetical protein
MLSSVASGYRRLADRARFSSPAWARLAAVFILSLPILMLFCWHVSNHRAPNDDAADYAIVGVQIAQEFQDHGWRAGLSALYAQRGWRPTLLPALFAPVFLAFHGALVPAVAAVLMSCFAILSLYTYLFFRSYLGAVAAAVGAVFIVTLAWVVAYSLVFFAELGMLAALAAAAYHGKRSDYWSSLPHSLAFALALGLVVTMRPEAASVAGIGVLTVAAGALRNRRLGVVDLIIALCCLLLLLGLLGSGFGGTSRHASLLCIILVGVLAGVALGVWRSHRPISRGFAGFYLAFSLIVGLWYIPFIDETVGWISATTVGPTVRLYSGGGAFDFWGTAHYVVAGLGAAPLAIATVAAASAIGESAIGTNSRDGTRREGLWITAMGIAALSLAIVSMTLLGGSDIRRAFSGGYVLLAGLVILSLGVKRGWLRFLRLGTIAAMATAQLAATAMVSVFGTPDPILPAWVRDASLLPYRKSDPSELTLRAITPYLSPDSNVAVQALSLNYFVARAFDPSSLNLLAVIQRTNLRFGYPTLFETLDEGYAQLNKGQFQYLLLDTRRDFLGDLSKRKLEEPYMRLTLDLINQWHRDKLEGKGWRFLATVQVDDLPLQLLERSCELPSRPVPPAGIVAKTGGEAYNIVTDRALSYGIPQSLGPIDVAGVDVAGMPAVITRCSVSGVKSEIVERPYRRPSDLAQAGGAEPPTTDAAPHLVDSLGTYNIIAYRGLFYGVPQGLGTFDLASVDVTQMPGVVTGHSVSEVKSDILERLHQPRSGSTQADDAAPHLVEAVGTYNIIAYRDLFYGIPQGLGTFDVASVDVTQMPGVVTGRSVSEVKSEILERLHQPRSGPAQAEAAAPHLVDAVGAYNIIAYRDLFYGIPQGLGTFDLASVDVTQMPGVVTGRSVAEVKSEILERIHQPRSGPAQADDAPPHLVDSVGTYNIVAYRGLFYGMPQGLGSIDLTHVDVAQMPGVITRSSLSDLKSEMRDRLAAKPDGQ